MTTQKKTGMITSDSDSDSGSDIDKEMLSAIASKKAGGNGGEKKVKVETITSDYSDFGSGGSPLLLPSWEDTVGNPDKQTDLKYYGVNEVNEDWGVDPPHQVGLPDPAANLSEKKKGGELIMIDDEDEVFDDGYDDNFVGDAEDHRKLCAMTQVEREQEIYQRITKRELGKGRLEVEKRLRAKKRMEAEGSKKVDLGFWDGTGELPTDLRVKTLEIKKRLEEIRDKERGASGCFKDARGGKTQERKRERVHEKNRGEQSWKDKEGSWKDRRSGKDKGSWKDKRSWKDKGSWKDKESWKDRESGKYKGSWKDKDKESTRGSEKLGVILKAWDVRECEAEAESNKSKVNKSGISDWDWGECTGSHSRDNDRSRKGQYVDQVEDLTKIQVSRFQMEKWLFLPFFSKVLEGSFIRLKAQTSRGGSFFRVAQILKVVEASKIYKFGNTRTNKAALVSPGPDQINNKTVRFEFVSNKRFTPEEFSRWKENNKVNNIEHPTLDGIDKKSKEIKEAMEYQVKDEDIDTIIKEKARFKLGPVNFAVRKIELLNDRKEALLNGEEAKATEIANEIQKLDERAKELDKMRTSSSSSISYINPRKRKNNVEEAEKVEKVERKDEKLCTEDLFSAHDFEIQLDLDAQLPPKIPIIRRPYSSM